jgi:hypothetical protein
MAMKKTLPAFLILAFISVSQTLTAQEIESATAPNTTSYKTALGVRLSTDAAVISNSISLKHFLNDRLAVEGFFSFANPAAVGGLLEIHKPIQSAEGLKWFYGAGVYIGFDSDKAKTTGRNLMGAMGSVGLDYKFPGIPLNLSLDWKPELNIVDEINFEPAAIGFSARFCFGKK